MRRMVGWMIAIAYAMSGARRRVAKKLASNAMLPIVIHALPAADLEKIFAWLKKRGVLDRLRLTFDDGWGVVKEYLPVLEKYGVRAMLFIAPGEILRGNVWTYEARQLGVPAEVWRGWYPLSESERNAKLSACSACSKRVKRSLLSKEDIIELSKHPLISIENHTWSHLSAPHRPVEEVMEEIRRAQDELKSWTGRAPEFLAWPFGRGNDALDGRVKSLGLTPLYTRQGYELPYCRNMAIENVSFQENLGRVLGAWPKVGETL